MGESIQTRYAVVISYAKVDIDVIINRTANEDQQGTSVEPTLDSAAQETEADQTMEEHGNEAPGDNNEQHTHDGSPISKVDSSKDVRSGRNTDHDSAEEIEETAQTTQTRKSTRTKSKDHRAQAEVDPKAAEEIVRTADGLIAKPGNFSVYRSWSAIPGIDMNKIATLKVGEHYCHRLSRIYRETLPKH